MKKIFAGVFSVLSLIAIIFFVRLCFLYVPFIKAQSNFIYLYEGGKTNITNNQFGIGFDAIGKCYIDAEVMRRITASMVWSGNLDCEKDGYIVLQVIEEKNYTIPEGSEVEMFQQERVKIVKSKNGGVTWINIANKEDGTYLLITSPSQEIINYILKTLTFLD